MARFADLIGSPGTPSEPGTPTEQGAALTSAAPHEVGAPDSPAFETQAEVNAALAALSDARESMPAPDPAEALAAAFGTTIIEPGPPAQVAAEMAATRFVDLAINDDLIPARPARGRRR